MVISAAEKALASSYIHPNPTNIALPTIPTDVDSPLLMG
jgi:hypothetical protein